MTHSERISALIQADAYARLQDSIAVVRAELGPRAPIHVRVPTHLLEDIASSSGGWAGVRLVAWDTPIDSVRTAVTTPYVLVLPPSDPLALTGVATAAAILDDEHDVGEVGGFVLAAPNSVVSGGLVEIDRPHSESLALAPVEAGDPTWTAVGAAAVTPVALLGGLNLLRAERLTGGHLLDGSILARALAGFEPGGRSRRFLLSSFAALTRGGVDLAFADSGTVEDLPRDTFLTWRDQRLREVSVLHRGIALRDDDAERIVLIAENRIKAVDDRGERRPEDPSAYYGSVMARQQLGPAFRVLYELLRPRQPATTFPEAMRFPTALELQLLVRVRRIARYLPGPLLRVVRRLLRSAGPS